MSLVDKMVTLQTFNATVALTALVVASSVSQRERRAERDYVDWVLLGVSSLLRDRIAAGVGGGAELRINADLEPGDAPSFLAAVRGLAGVEQARAELAEDVNLNPRLVLERAFLHLVEKEESRGFARIYNAEAA